MNKKKQNYASQMGSLFGDALSKNFHNASDCSIEGMESFMAKALQIRNVDFDQAKGNLFEYIEAAKFNQDAALKGSDLNAVVTDAIGRPHDAADILIKNGNKTVRQVQAKFSKTTTNGHDSSAASTVFQQAGGQNGHWGKYNNMQRLGRKQDHYNEYGSLLDEEKRLAKKRADAGGIHAKEYEDVYNNLTDELHYKNVSSGGTTFEEVKEAYSNNTKYAKSFERKAFMNDMKNTSKNMAIASAVSNGVISGVSNFFEVFKDEKNLSDALKDVGVDISKGAIRGGSTGVLSTTVRTIGKKNAIGILEDSSAATVIAGGMIDGGVALYSYAKGEITSEQLTDELMDTTIKSVSTVYFTKAVQYTLGATNPFIPMAIYTATTMVVKTTKEIIKNAKLSAEENDRLAILIDEQTTLIQKQREIMNEQMKSYQVNQTYAMNDLLNSFQHNLENTSNYDLAISSIIHYANQTGIALQHTDFHDFKSAMLSDDDFVLR